MDASQYTDLNVPQRILLGPGPSMMPARVSQAFLDDGPLRGYSGYEDSFCV